MSEMPNVKPPVARSPKWGRVRRNYLAQHPRCEACGGTEKLEVHHCQPYHLFPARELDPTNLIALCEHPDHSCHLIFGHLLNFESYNVAVREDAARYLKEVADRPKQGIKTENGG